MSDERAQRSGTVFAIGDERWFLPAKVAMRVARVASVTKVPGAPPELVGIAHVEGEILPILAPRAKAPSPARAVVCDHMGEHVGVAVDEILHAGLVDADPDLADAVRFEDRSVRTLDLAALCARVQRLMYPRVR
jgi:chemotaxis signal transduction protein